MGAAAAIMWSRGINPFQTDIGMLILFNLAVDVLYRWVDPRIE